MFFKRLISTSNQILFKNRHFISIIGNTDPYYILGVQKTQDFQQIKKQFYKLANQFHPDKNSAPEASRQFLLIKQAFEAIKSQRGLSVAQNLQRSEGKRSQQSMRPNAHQYEQDYSFTGSKQNVDYKIFQQKTPDGKAYDKFKTSFSTIDNINDIKFKVQEGEIKDSSDRFGINVKQKSKIKILSQGGISFIIIIPSALFVFFILANYITSTSEQHKIKEDLHSLLKKQYRSAIMTNNELSDNEIKKFNTDQQYIKFKQNQQLEKKKNSNFLDLTKHNKVISREKIQSV